LQGRNLDKIASYFCCYVSDMQSLDLPTQSQVLPIFSKMKNFDWLEGI